MTISTTASSVILGGNGATTTFAFPFVMGAAANAVVIYTDASGNSTQLSPSQYAISLNAPAAGQIWGIGGTVIYPLSGSPVANGATLTISRLVPLTQQTSISNQGDFSPEVIEAALDTLCMEIQQVSARSGQLRGPWISGARYNYADLVQDGVNGNNSGNWYLCAIANTSGVWATDLANGDWILAVEAVLGIAPLPLSIANGGTGAATAAAARAALGAAKSGANTDITSLSSPSLGAATATTQASSDNTTKVATTAMVQSAVSGIASAAAPPQGRLSLQSLIPVPTTEIAATSTVYYVPYNGQTVPVFNGTLFQQRTIGTPLVISQQLGLQLDNNSGHTGYQQSGKLFDLFAFMNSGALTLGSGPAWASSVSRGSGAGTTQLQFLAGIWCNQNAIALKIDTTATQITVPSGQATYLGTMYATGDGITGMIIRPAWASGGTNNFLGLWNAWNRIPLRALCVDSTTSWTYASGTTRMANNSASNRISWVDGLGQSFVKALYTTSTAGTSTSSQAATVGVQLDGATSLNNTIVSQSAFTGAIAFGQQCMGWDDNYPQLGFHFYQALEESTSTGIQFFGDGFSGLELTLDM